MIENIHLENFKCFRNLEVNPKLITILIGPNGTGKSSVLQALALFKQSIGHSGLRFSGGQVNFARYHDIVPSLTPPSAAPMAMGFSGVVSPDELIFGEIGTEARYSFQAEFDDSGNISRTFGGFWSKHIGTEFGFEMHVGDDFSERMLSLGPYEAALRYVKNIAQLVECGGWRTLPDQDTRRQFDILIRAANYELAMLRFVPGARGLTRPVYGMTDQLLNDLPVNAGSSEREQQTATNLVYSRQIENRISDFVESVTGMRIRAEPVPPKSVEVRALGKVGPINIVGEGFGTNALIFLAHQLVNAEDGSCILIEEPEIHLHPKAQADVASALAEEAKAHDKQLIITTHSEHLLGRFLTLVVERKLSSDDIALYSFSKDGEGACSADKLEITEDGKVKGGLKDFFESELEEMDRYMKALQIKE